MEFRRVLFRSPALLKGCLVVIRYMGPLAQEWQCSPKNPRPILNKKQPFRSAGAIFQCVDTRLHLLKTMLTEQAWSFTQHTLAVRGKGKACLMGGLYIQLLKARMSRAVGL